ncbi:MAG TPA: hypothetical protein VIM30_16310 [Candidatus Limnocylindrales bacterium]
MAEVIVARLEAAGCRVVAPPESFLVGGFTGPLVAGEEERAERWAVGVAERLTITTA